MPEWFCFGLTVALLFIITFQGKTHRIIWKQYTDVLRENEELRRKLTEIGLE